MAVVVEVYNTPGDYVFFCVGCGYHHNLNTKRLNDDGIMWRFNGDLRQPTFVPAVDITIPYKDTYERCHFNIVAGIIHYREDCTHEFAGCKMYLPQIKETDYRYYSNPQKNKKICIKK